MPKTNRLRGLAGRALFVLWTVFACFVLTEAVLQAAGVFVRFRADARMAAARGIPAGTVRILCVGDSHCFGLGAPEGMSYPAQLGRILDEDAALRRRHKGFSVINAGVPGATTRRVRDELPALLAAYRPRAVFVFAGVNNHNWDYDYWASSARAWPLRLLSRTRLWRLFVIARIRLRTLVFAVGLRRGRERQTFASLLPPQAASRAFIADELGHVSRDLTFPDAKGLKADEIAEQIARGETDRAKAGLCLMLTDGRDEARAAALMGDVFLLEGRPELARTFFLHSVAAAALPERIMALADACMAAGRADEAFAFLMSVLYECSAEQENFIYACQNVNGVPGALDRIAPRLPGCWALFVDVCRRLERIPDVFARLGALSRSDSAARLAYRFLSGREDIEKRINDWVAADMRAIARMCRESGAEPVIMGYFGQDKLESTLERVAGQTGTRFINNIVSFDRFGSRRTEYFAPDRHPNARGYRIIAQNALKVLRETL